MKRRGFLNVVPQPVQIAACAIVCVAVLVGLVVGIVQAPASNQVVMLESLAGIGIGLLVGSFVALWILCLGYVYADARRRAMPPVLWTLLAALVPNLLGFLFYFALRKPIVSACPQCGQGMEAGQRFCASCGFDKLVTPAGTDQAGLRSNLV